MAAASLGCRHDNLPMRQDKPAPLTDAERDALEQLLDDLPAPLEPPDLCALDGFLVGVLLQPQRVPEATWLAHVHDLDGRPAPPGVDLTRAHALVRRRHGELERAIAARRWFDPWVFELDGGMPSECVLPWVAGFAAAQDLFTGLMARVGGEALEPLAVLYAHFDPDDLEDADDLLALIDTLEPPATLAEAVEDLVRCTLLLADVTRPRKN
jgi:uncharacterized protein